MSSLALPTGSFTQAAGMGGFNAVQFNQATFNQSGTPIKVESHFYLFDLQSSSRLLLDENAATDNEYLYKAFGEKVLSTGSIRNPFQFQGQVGPYFDANDRICMRARIYNPITGRWESSDPIGFDGGDWNLYRFVGNNSVNWFDPKGMWCWCCNKVFAPLFCCDLTCVYGKIQPNPPVKVKNGQCKLDVNSISKDIVRCINKCGKTNKDCLQKCGKEQALSIAAQLICCEKYKAIPPKKGNPCIDPKSTTCRTECLNCADYNRCVCVHQTYKATDRIKCETKWSDHTDKCQGMPLSES